MKFRTHNSYSKELREEAVKLVLESGNTIQHVARELCLPRSTLSNWVRAHKSGNLCEIRSIKPPLTELEKEHARVKRELIQIKQERDILKKAAAYFAKESLTDTR